MIKTTLLVVLLAIFVATIQAANPFDTNNRPFVIGGKFKRVERKLPGSNFACYNTTLGDWSEYKWTDAAVSVTSPSNIVQLSNGYVITLKVLGSTNYGFLYWNLDSASVITTTATVMQASSAPVIYLSYDQKKLYVGAVFTRLGATVYTGTDIKYRIVSFDISSLPTLGAPTDITSNYGLTYSLANPAAVYPVSNGNQLLFVYDGTKIVVFDPASTSWKEINPSVIKADSQFQLSSATGELYAKSYDNTSPYASSFWKYDSTNSAFFVNVKTLAASSYITSALTANSYVAKWTVGGGAIYYATWIENAGTNFENGMQNIQKITLSPSASDPVSIGKTRLTTNTARSSFDTQPLSTYITTMYYDETTKQLVIVLNSDSAYQIYGTRDSDMTKLNYQLTYRFQPMGRYVAYDATADAYVVPYGGAFGTQAARLSAYASTASVSCFTGLTEYYRTWAPNFAVYDQGKDMFVSENLLSGQLDYDWLNGVSSDSFINAIENSDDSSVVYVGGYFRTISGAVYNSIVSRTKTGLVALGTGLRKHNFDYNYFDTTPGTVTKLVRSKDNKYLFVLGDFNRAGDLWVNNLAYWDIDKKTWNRLETHAMDTITDMDYDGRYLYVVGSITRAGKYVVKNAARFDMNSQTWLPMNAGLDSAASAGIVVDGKFVALASSGSGVSFFNNLAVWSSNSWKAIEMDSISNNGCYTDKEVCTRDISYTSATYYKGRIYFLSPGYVYVSDTSMSKGTLYARGLVGATTISANTKFFNYPKSNTLVVATLGANDFVEYNIDTKNIQHTPTRDTFQVADGIVNAISAAPKNVMATVAMIVALLVTLFF